MPRFEEEEEVLVFLKKDVESTDFKVFDGSNGKISIVEDKQTGEKITTSKVQLRSLKAQIKAHLNE
jgi:hypothetical protein